MWNALATLPSALYTRVLRLEGTVQMLLESLTALVFLPADRRAGPEDVLNLGAAERAAIDEALRRTGGHQAQAAKLLGITQRVLNYKLHERSRRRVAIVPDDPGADRLPSTGVRS
jgi:transcriptional regulator with GAF, ATPase, and Fis domain